MALEAWYAAFVPLGTPPEIVARLNDEMTKALKDPTLVETFSKGAIEPVGGTGGGARQARATDSEKYARLVKELSIETTN